ncbi:MAG: C4-dicarboxylate ABC transporter substrate-binding protein [Alphaproteobacteria bacterium HGW-Alphaproteobacteria-2]|nr:MAG: C4-dicarboxylate ABC transporter substrate-binding protein [Alphaproteobacteria bacterium HGW-Alphaproteobacteria-2]
MHRALRTAAVAALATAFATEAMAVEWNVSLWGKRRAFTEHVEKLAELVAEKTGGEFTLNISYGGLSPERENLDGISIGAFEMAQFCASYHPDKNPSLTVLELPFLGVQSLEQERMISQALYEHPAVRADLARWNAVPIMPSPMPQYNFVGVGAPPQTVEDFKGLSVRALGGIGKAMEAVAHMSFGTIETGQWWTTNLNPGTVNCPVVVNSDALDALSDEHRAALMGSIDEALDHYIDFYLNQTMAAWGPALESRGIAQITYPAEELAKLREQVAGPAQQAWVTENAARGIPAQDLLDFVTAKIAE